MNAKYSQIISIVVIVLTLSAQRAQAGDIDLKEARILMAEKPRSATEPVAAQMLQEEVQKRTGLKWPVASEYDGRQPAIALVTMGVSELAGLKVPSAPGLKREGYRICVEQEAGPVVWVIGADARGVLFGVGRLLRLLDWGPSRAALADTTDIATSPAYPIRGHQLGYRARANSYDAWTCGGLRAVHPRSGPLRDQLH